MILRRKANAEIKLLRLGLLARPNSPCEEIDDTWTHAQPEENLSPEKAGLALSLDSKVPQSVVKKRYRTLQLRYPADQFMEKHIEWGPSAELLGNPKMRLNWYWQSGLIPEVEFPMDCKIALEKLCER